MKIMAEPVKRIKELLQGRMNSRIEALKAFEPSNLNSLPDDVKMEREKEASRIRAVVQEEKDLIEIISIMYPDA